MPALNGSHFKRQCAREIGEGEQDVGFEQTLKEGHLRGGSVEEGHRTERGAQGAEPACPFTVTRLTGSGPGECSSDRDT